MAESIASKNERLSDYIADITEVSLHRSDPGATGGNEVTGGSPAYARKVPSFSTPTNGATDLTGLIAFDVSAGTVSHYGLWKGMTWLGGEPLSTVETFGGQGIYQLQSLPITA